MVVQRSRHGFLILEAKLYGFDQLGVLQKDVSSWSLVLKSLVLHLASFISGPFPVIPCSQLSKERIEVKLSSFHVYPSQGLARLGLIKPLHCCRFCVGVRKSLRGCFLLRLSWALLENPAAVSPALRSCSCPSQLCHGSEIPPGLSSSCACCSLPLQMLSTSFTSPALVPRRTSEIYQLPDLVWSDECLGFVWRVGKVL